ncbi:MAG: 50S ribosomal protein L25/general stress protein Ctc [Methylococcales bacterium]|nr:50S ribosomal protein L25/general stress protein Ctc [Methylococcales bacterium]
MTTIKAEVRTVQGKGASRRLRFQNKIPAVIYGSGKDPISLNLTHNEFWHAIEDEGIFSKTITLSIDGAEEPVIIKDMQRHPFKQLIMHVDFQRVSEDVAIKMTVPLNFTGQEDSPAAKAGGRLSVHVRNVNIECLSKDIPESLSADTSEMQEGEMIHLSNIQLPEGVVITTLKYGAKFNAPVAAFVKGK